MAVLHPSGPLDWNEYDKDTIDGNIMLPDREFADADPVYAGRTPIFHDNVDGF